MNLSRISILSLLAFGLCACDSIKTPDGKIPGEYLDGAKKYEGTYRGMFNGVAGELSLKLDGDTPVVSYTDAFGHELLGAGCGSAIGKLTEVDTTLTDRLGAASFEFDPGRCQIEGRSLELSFEKSQNDLVIKASILRDYKMVHLPGDISCTTHGQGSESCHIRPGSWVRDGEFISGKFKKISE